MSSQVEYTVLLHQAEEGGYWAEVPSLPGCFSQGESEREALANVKGAIESHIAALLEDGQDVPVEAAPPVQAIRVSVDRDAA